MSTLFVSDLHLDPAWPEITRQFLAFLAGPARRADALYILGDLFEAWIGDDDPEPANREIVAALRALTHSGVPVYLIHGNRDFMLGERFCRETGGRLLADGTIVEIEGEHALLMHGDALCTDDLAYQRLRRIVRNPLVRFAFRHMTLAQRRALALRMRAGSRMHVTEAPPAIMDVNARAVADAFRRAGVATLIHGHTHRPAIHALTVDGRVCRRVVLGDWYAQGSVLEWSSSGLKLQSMPRPGAGIAGSGTPAH